MKGIIKLVQNPGAPGTGAIKLASVSGVVNKVIMFKGNKIHYEIKFNDNFLGTKTIRSELGLVKIDTSYYRDKNLKELLD